MYYILGCSLGPLVSGNAYMVFYCNGSGVALLSVEDSAAASDFDIRLQTVSSLVLSSVRVPGSKLQTLSISVHLHVYIYIHRKRGPNSYQCLV